ncbi:MAG: SDR family NAD(P)-dependent oxidoreductase [Planctomycetota bacterium]|nr:SDR family NAD(P)-dependent oxidoreductase [Planctomycetota bacterium]
MTPEPRRVALVTGGARGLGLACARRLASEGVSVHIAFRSSGPHVDELRREFGGRVHPADVEREGDWARLVSEVLGSEGRLDHFVHCVGEYEHGPLSDVAATTLQRLFENNVLSAHFGFAALRPALRASRGTAVLFGCAGVDTARARRDAAAYVAAKTALLVLARSWAQEEAEHGVRVNMVAPGLVPHEHASEDTLDESIWRRIPFGRPGEPREVAEVVAWLSSSASSYVTGAVVPVAGGWML